MLPVRFPRPLKLVLRLLKRDPPADRAKEFKFFRGKLESGVATVFLDPDKLMILFFSRGRGRGHAIRDVETVKALNEVPEGARGDQDQSVPTK